MTEVQPTCYFLFDVQNNADDALVVFAFLVWLSFKFAFHVFLQHAKSTRLGLERQRTRMVVFLVFFGGYNGL